jgi:predicted nucleotide-binding protein
MGPASTPQTDAIVVYLKEVAESVVRHTLRGTSPVALVKPVLSELNRLDPLLFEEPARPKFLMVKAEFERLKTGLPATGNRFAKAFSDLNEILSEYKPLGARGDQEKTMLDARTIRTIIVHGHDERNLLALKDLLVSKLKMSEPLIMSQQMIPGASLPEKFEQLASEVDFALALLTPDDVGRSAMSPDLQPRPRQNTLVEIGWFWGRLGRGRILLLVKKELELPSDLQGVEYHRFEAKVEEVTEKIRDFYAADHRLAKLH